MQLWNHNKLGWEQVTDNAVSSEINHSLISDQINTGGLADTL